MKDANLPWLRAGSWPPPRNGICVSFCQTICIQYHLHFWLITCVWNGTKRKEAKTHFLMATFSPESSLMASTTEPYAPSPIFATTRYLFMSFGCCLRMQMSVGSRSHVCLRYTTTSADRGRVSAWMVTCSVIRYLEQRNPRSPDGLATFSRTQRCSTPANVWSPRR